MRKKTRERQSKDRWVSSVWANPPINQGSLPSKNSSANLLEILNDMVWWLWNDGLSCKKNHKSGRYALRDLLDPPSIKNVEVIGMNYRLWNSTESLSMNDYKFRLSQFALLHLLNPPSQDAGESFLDYSLWICKNCKMMIVYMKMTDLEFFTNGIILDWGKIFKTAPKN